MVFYVFFYIKLERIRNGEMKRWRAKTKMNKETRLESGRHTDVYKTHKGRREREREKQKKTETWSDIERNSFNRDSI